MRPEPAANFDRLAGVYRWMEYLSFGPFLHRARTYFLGEVIDRRNALILGDGDGRFTRDLLMSNGQIRVEAIDASAAMLRALERRAGRNAGRLRTEQADVRGWRPVPGARYDLIATHFLLDCLTTAEVAELAAGGRPALDADGVWLVSDFAIPEGSRGRYFARPIVGGLYWAFGLLTGLRARALPDHHGALGAAGFRLEACHRGLGGLVVSELWGIEGRGVS